MAGQAGSGDGDYLPEDCDYMNKALLSQTGGFRNLFS